MPLIPVRGHRAHIAFTVMAAGVQMARLPAHADPAELPRGVRTAL